MSKYFNISIFVNILKKPLLKRKILWYYIKNILRRNIIPTYEYQCSFCDYKFEIMQNMSASVKKKCPKCKKMKLDRLIGAGSGIIFKGSGFYQTDYRSDSYKKDVDKNTKKPASKDKTIKKGPDKKNTESNR